MEVFKAKGTDLETGNLLLCLCGMIFKTSVCSDIYSPMLKKKARKLDKRAQNGLFAVVNRY